MAGRRKTETKDAHTTHAKIPSIDEQIETLRAVGWSAFEVAIKRVEVMKPFEALEFWKRCIEVEMHLEGRRAKLGGTQRGAGVTINGFDPAQIVLNGRLAAAADSAGGGAVN